MSVCKQECTCKSLNSIFMISNYDLGEDMRNAMNAFSGIEIGKALFSFIFELKTNFYHIIG